MVLSALEMAPTFIAIHVQALVPYALNAVSSTTHMSALPVLSLHISQAIIHALCVVHLSITVFSALLPQHAQAVPIPTPS